MQFAYRWLAIILLLMPIGTSAPAWSATLELSAPERAWLDAHPVIRMGVDTGYGPYTFLGQDGQVEGLAVDLMTEIESRLGIRFEYITHLSWPQLMDAVRAGHIDAVATVAHLPERDAFLEFSEPYLLTPLMIVTRADTPQLRSLKELEPLRLALVEGYSSSRQVMTQYPKLRPLLVTTPLDGLRAVASGSADAYVGVLGVNTFLAAQQGIANLKINAAFDMEANTQRFGVRKDWPQLAPILNKALDAIPADHKNAIYQHWLPTLTDDIVRLSQPSLITRLFPWLIGTLVLALVAYLLILFWHRQLKRELARRQQDLKDSVARLKAATALAHLGHWEYRVANGHIEWADETYRIFGLEPQSLEMTYANMIKWVHPDDREHHDAYLKKMLDSQPGDTIGELRYRLLRGDGETREVSVRVSIEYDASGKPTHLFGAIQDITVWQDMLHTLQEQLDELTRWQAVMLGREDRVQALKAEINTLLAERGQPARYPSQVEPT